jgi:adenylate cyclase
MRRVGAMPEVERKFRVAEPPPGVGDGSRIRQAYVAIDGDVEVRIRDEDGACSLTVKGGHGLERAEVEVAIDAGRFDELWSLAGERHLEKRRARVPVGDVVAELDRYEGRLAGLAVVEVEFGGREAAAAFVPPAWFGEELTGQRAWSNAALARDGAPDQGRGADREPR